MSSSKMVDTAVESSSDPSCSSCAKLKEALEASKREHSLTLRMVKEKIISTDELIKKYQQKCHESDKHQQQSTDSALKLEAAQMKMESLQSQLDRTLHSSEPLRKNVARLHREKSLADSTISELREKLQNFEKMNSELLSTAKIKEEQECAWRLEKQVQAQELQKQKKSLQKSEATISKLQEEVKKAKEKNKELNKLLGQANRKATKIEQQLQKSKEEIQSVKLEAEFAKALGEDLTKKTPKPRQRQKARQPPRQPPVELKQTSPSDSHPNQHLAHIIEELAMLSEMEPALSPLPPSPDREALEDSSSSEEESGSGGSSEDDGSGNEDEDSDYSLGDLADMLIGDHGEGENLAASPMKTRSSDQDIYEDVENSTGQETTTKSDADCANTENESSARQPPSEASADIEVSEHLFHADRDLANPESETSKTTENDTSDRKKKDDESAETKEPANIEKCTVATPSPQRKAKRRVASPKPRVMTRSRAKAMKLSSSSDAESSSERESGLEVNSTQENSSEVLNMGFKRDSNGRSNDGGIGNNENVSPVALVDSIKELIESSQANDNIEHAEGNFQGILSDSSNTDADDAAHHHGNLREPVCSVASFSDQESTEHITNVSLVGVEADVAHPQTNEGERSCSGALGTDSEEQAGTEDIPNVLLIGMDTDAIEHQKNDGQLSPSKALLSGSEKQGDDSNVLSFGVDTDVNHQQENDGQLSPSRALLLGSEKQVDNEDNTNVSSVGMDKDVNHQQKNDGQLSCAGALLTVSKEQVGNEDNSTVFTGGLETDGSRCSHSTALLSEQVTKEDNSDVTSAPVSEAAANLPTDLEIETNQEISTTSKSGFKINDDAQCNMAKEENPNINEIPSVDFNNENTDSILANKAISEKNTEESQTYQDSKITADVNGNTILSQSETKGNAFERRDDTLEEINNNISEGFEAASEIFEVGSALVVDADSSDQTQPFVRETQNHSTCTTVRKRSDVSDLCTSCDDTKNEDRLKEQVFFPSDQESDADYFPCVVPGKATVSKFVETSKGEPADVSSSTVEVDLNMSTLTCEKETTMTTTETTECSSTKSQEVENSDSKMTGGHSHAPDEAMQSCSIDEHEGKDSTGQDSSIQNIPVLTSESSGKNSVLEKDESLSSDGEEFSTCNEERKNSDCVKDVPASKTLIEEASEPSTSNERRKNSDCVKDVSALKTVIKEASEPSTSNERRKNSDCVKDVPSSKTAIKKSSEPSTSNEERNNSDCVKDILASKTAIEEASEPSTSNEERKNSDCVEDVLASKTAIEGAIEPSTSYEGKKKADCVKDVPASKTAIKEASEPSTSNEERKNSDSVKDVPASKTVIEEASEPSTSRERRKESDWERDVSSIRTMTEKPSSSSNHDEKRPLDKKKYFSSRERSSTVNEGKKHSDMGRDVSSTATRKESCVTFSEGKNNPLGRDVSSRTDFRESPLTLASIQRKRNSALERNMSSRAMNKEGSSTFNVGKGNSDLGRDVSPRITSKEGSSSNKKEMLSNVDVREQPTFDETRKRYAIKGDVSSPRTATEKAGERKHPSLSRLDSEESKLEETGTCLELPWSPNDAGPSDDSPAVCDPVNDSPIQTLFNSLEGLLEEFPALSPLPPSPCPSDDEECLASPIVSSNVTKEKSNRVTELTSAKKTFDVRGKPEFKRDQELNYTEVARRSVKGTSLRNSATMCITESNKLNISVTPRNSLAKDKTSKSASTSCSGGSASIKPPLQRSVSAPPRGEENVSLKRSYQQSVSEPVNNKNDVSQKSKKMKTQPKILQKEDTSSLERRLGISRVPVEKATLSQPTRTNSATKGPVLVDRKGSTLTDSKKPERAGNKGPILVGNKEPILAGKKEPKLAGKKEPKLSGNKGSILAGSKEPVLVGNDGPILDFDEGPVLEEGSENTNNSTKATGKKHSKYRPLSVRPGYMPEVKYVFKCLSRVHEDNVDLRIVVERLTTKRCISSSTPVASAIIQFLKEREDNLIPQILDQLEHFQASVGTNNWQPVISSFESRLLEVISLLSNDTLFGNLISRLVSLCSRSLTEARCSSNDEEVIKGDLSLCRILTALSQVKENLGCARTVCYDVIRSLYRSQEAALELVVTMVAVWPEVLKTSSDCSRGEQSPLAHTLKLMLLYWAEKSPSADMGNILRVLCCWEDDSVAEDELKRFGLQLIQPLREERVEAIVGLGKDGSLVLERHSFQVVKSLELLSCVLGWEWTLNDLIVKNVWQILKSWAEKETRNELTTNGLQLQAASSSEENRLSACCCGDFIVSSEVSSVTVLADEGTNGRSGFTTTGEEKEGGNQVGAEEVPEICPKCGKLTGSRLPESQAVLCIQLLGVLCRIAIDNGQTPVREITDMLCGLIEDSSPTSKSQATQTSSSSAFNQVTYAIQLASAVSLLDMSPWQPERVAAVLSKWVAALKESGSLQAPAYVAQGLVCLKSFLRIHQT